MGKFNILGSILRESFFQQTDDCFRLSQYPRQFWRQVEKPWLFPFSFLTWRVGLPWWLGGQESIGNAGDMGLIPRSGRATGEGNGNPLQYWILAWTRTGQGIVPWTEEPSGLQSTGVTRIGHGTTKTWRVRDQLIHSLVYCVVDEVVGLPWWLRG